MKLKSAKKDGFRRFCPIVRTDDLELAEAVGASLLAFGATLVHSCGCPVSLRELGIVVAVDNTGKEWYYFAIDTDGHSGDGEVEVETAFLVALTLALEGMGVANPLPGVPASIYMQDRKTPSQQDPSLN